MKYILITFLTLTFLACDSQKKETVNESQYPNNEVAVSDNANTVKKDAAFVEKKDLKTIGNELIAIFYNKEYEKLSAYIKNEDRKIVFSPYLYIDTTSVKKLTLEELKEYEKSNRLLNWGWYDGSGEPIKLSLSDYVDRFVYDVDYLNETDTITIDEVHMKGNSINNISDIYPEANYIHYYRAPKDPELGEMDWRSLIFVFEEVNTNYYLIAVVHNEWTI